MDTAFSAVLAFIVAYTKPFYLHQASLGCLVCLRV